MTVGFSGEEASPLWKKLGTACRAPAVNGHGQRITVMSFLCFIRHSSSDVRHKFLHIQFYSCIDLSARVGVI
jgi:hypothetical protein